MLATTRSPPHVCHHTLLLRSAHTRPLHFSVPSQAASGAARTRTGGGPARWHALCLFDGAQAQACLPRLRMGSERCAQPFGGGRQLVLRPRQGRARDALWSYLLRSGARPSSSHLISSRLVSSHRTSYPPMASNLISSHPISSRLALPASSRRPKPSRSFAPCPPARTRTHRRARVAPVCPTWPTRPRADTASSRPPDTASAAPDTLAPSRGKLAPMRHTLRAHSLRHTRCSGIRSAPFPSASAPHRPLRIAQVQRLSNVLGLSAQRGTHRHTGCVCVDLIERR
jgi:hypothetical protein